MTAWLVPVPDPGSVKHVAIFKDGFVVDFWIAGERVDPTPEQMQQALVVADEFGNCRRDIGQVDFWVKNGEIQWECERNIFSAHLREEFSQ